MYLGIDLGTSGLKAVLIDAQGQLVASASAALEVSRPKPLWSEQSPQDWWMALEACMDDLKSRCSMSEIKSIGLSGQMHGATLLDADNEVLRPAILWNDGRCEAQCQQIEADVPDSRNICGNIIMPGFTAPKLLWVNQHEPDVFSRISKVLLPKDYLRFKLTGDFASDMSDSAGTAWLDVQKRTWSEPLLSACGLTVEHMPALFEGSDITGQLSAELAERWGMRQVPVIAGGGDNAAGAIGVGIVKPGQAMLSLGTSGVYFVVGDGYFSNPDSAVHSFCHALPGTWHLMSVILSAASCLQWYADQIANEDISVLLEELESTSIDLDTNCYFLPYLSGERTPYNNPHATGAFFGLTHSTSRAQMTHAVLEGVSFAFADGVDALHGSGLSANEINVIGGGSKSAYWRQLLADVLSQSLACRSGGDVGPALGAARLAMLAVNNGMTVDDVCHQPDLEQRHTPDAEKHQMYSKRLDRYRDLYQAIKPLF